MEYAFIKNGKVIDRIVCDKEFADDRAAELGCTHTTASSAQPGFKKSGSRYTDDRPAPAPQEEKPSISELDSLSKAQIKRIIDFLTTV